MGGHGISNNAVSTMLRDFVRFLHHYGMLRVKNPLPGRLRAMMGKLEGVGCLPVDHKMILCKTSKV